MCLMFLNVVPHNILFGILAKVSDFGYYFWWIGTNEFPNSWIALSSGTWLPIGIQLWRQGGFCYGLPIRSVCGVRAKYLRALFMIKSLGNRYILELASPIALHILPSHLLSLPPSIKNTQSAVRIVLRILISPWSLCFFLLLFAVT
jgi:hypothetical protein